MRDHTYFVYILTNASRRSLYIGVTNALKTRVRQHREKQHEGFTAHYNVDRLVYYEAFQFIHAAIAREKQLKGWTRAKKLALICTSNPQFQDLSAEWFKPHPAEPHAFGGHIPASVIPDPVVLSQEPGDHSALRPVALSAGPEDHSAQYPVILSAGPEDHSALRPVILSEGRGDQSASEVEGSCVSARTVQPQDVSTPNPDLPPDSPLNMTKREH